MQSSSMATAFGAVNPVIAIGIGTAVPLTGIENTAPALPLATGSTMYSVAPSQPSARPLGYSSGEPVWRTAASPVALESAAKIPGRPIVSNAAK